MTGIFDIINKAVRRGRYRTICLAIFGLSAILSFCVFYGPEGKEVSLRPYATDDINNMRKITQNSSGISRIPANIPNIATAHTEEDKKKTTPIGNVDLQINQIDEKILLISNEVDDFKRKIDFLNNQIKSPQQIQTKNMQAPDTVSTKKEQQTDTNIQDAHKEISKLQSLISSDEEKLADLKGQKETLIKQKQHASNTKLEEKQQ